MPGKNHNAPSATSNLVERLWNDSFNEVNIRFLPLQSFGSHYLDCERKYGIHLAKVKHSCDLRLGCHSCETA